MITYNHENYITQALESILMQKCDFNFEIVIGEDCSTDKTREILLGYKIKYPKIFKLLLNEKNIGAVRNQINTLKSCSGEFIAICEGDDYWSDPFKLQKQVDFLEAHEEFVLHCTNAKRFDQELNVYSQPILNTESKELDIKDFFKEDNPVITCTSVFRKPNMEILKGISYDLTIWVNLLAHYNKKAFYSNEITAIYRHHNRGAMSKIGNVNSLKVIIGIHKSFLIRFPKFRNEINESITSLSTKLLKEILQINRIDGIIFFFVNKKHIDFTFRDLIYVLRKKPKRK